MTSGSVTMRAAAACGLILALGLGMLALTGCQPSGSPAPGGSPSQGDPEGDAPQNDQPAADGASPANPDPTPAATAEDTAKNGGEAPSLPSPGNGTSAAGEVQEISFDDIILQLQADVVFRPWMLNDRVQELDGKRVRIAGYMLPDAQLKNIKEFVLLRNTECKFGPGGQADHLINVQLQEGEETQFRNDPVRVEGLFQINPFQGPDGNTWYIYELNDAQGVTTVRR